MTSTDTGIRPASSTPGSAWKTSELPDPFHRMTTLLGDTLVARLIRPGERYGLTGTLRPGQPTLVEFRRQARIDVAFGVPGRPVLVLEASALAHSFQAGWQLTDPAMPYAVSDTTFDDFLLAFRQHRAATAGR